MSLNIVVVSLATAASRRERVEGYMNASPYPWRFFDASDGTGTALPYSEELALKHMGRPLTRAEIGCFDSHFRVLHEFTSVPGDGYLLVCEDDLWIDFSFPFDEAVEAMHMAGVGYLRLYARRAAGARHLTYWCNRWVVRYIWEPFGTQCYLVSRAGAEALLAQLTSISRPIDNAFDRFWENGVPPYSLVPAPVLELTSASSIVRAPQDGAAGWRLVAYRGRRLVDRLVAVAHGLRVTSGDRRFVAALAASAREGTSRGT